MYLLPVFEKKKFIFPNHCVYAIRMIPTVNISPHSISRFVFARVRECVMESEWVECE